MVVVVVAATSTAASTATAGCGGGRGGGGGSGWFIPLWTFELKDAPLTIVKYGSWVSTGQIERVSRENLGDVNGSISVRIKFLQGSVRDGVAEFFRVLDSWHAGADRVEDTVGLRWPDWAAKSSIRLTDKAVQTIAIWIQET